MPAGAEIWRNDLGSLSLATVPGQLRLFLVTLDQVASAVVDVVARSVSVVPVLPDVPVYTLQHFYKDQVLPALIDLDGQLALHGGAVVVGGRAVLFMGPSGAGKSTLVASLARRGYLILNDDCVTVTTGEAGFDVAGIYPGARLMPESLARFFPDTPTDPVAHYATKRRLRDPALFRAGPVPLAMIVMLETAPSDTIRLRPMAPTAACMAVIGQTFAFDPTDRQRAAHRMRQVAALTTSVPVMALRFPRDFDRLPAVHAVLFGAVAGDGP